MSTSTTVVITSPEVLPDIGTSAQTTAIPKSESSLSLRFASTANTDVVDEERSIASASVSSSDPLKLRRRRKSEEEIKTKGKKVQEFYRDQNELIDELLGSVVQQTEEEKRVDSLRLYAAISSRSLSLFATMADSFMDILSNGTLLFAGRAAHATNYLEYPTGKARMETAGIIVFSSFMSTVSIQLLIEAVKTLVHGGEKFDVNTIAIVCICVALVTKFGLFLYCYTQRHWPTAKVLAQDHRNDLLINFFGLTMSLLGGKLIWWLDPVGAIFVALIILRSWIMTARDQIQLIAGKSADPAILKKLTYMALTHDERVLQVDTCRAYYSGSKLYVEVDIVLDRETPLWIAHDVGESLQVKLESMPFVERAFVHVDYESNHRPEHQKDV
ncbi:990_t:CDS:2 [Paraglomus occultum]|uniref:990_t:CDS:1 n=1 Tax=Paraglomus occultum TaxID=144539 RepID=A0A9N9CDQ6_9GLOM|nr:990_t:CDS:2 [Paraglomus occultum]